MKLTRIQYLLFLATIIFFAGCGPASSSPKTEVHTVRIGYLPAIVSLPVFVAKDQGLFQKEGVSVSLVQFNNSADMGAALATGKIDIAASLATVVLLTQENKDPGHLKVFSFEAHNTTHYLTSLVVPEGSAITSVAGLKGKRIGCFPGPANVTLAKLALSANGVQPTTYSLVELPPPAQLSALSAHQIDADIAFEPTGTQAVSDLHAKRLVPAFIEKYVLNPTIGGSWVAQSDFISKDSTECKKTIAALYKAIDFIRGNPDAAKTSMADYTKLSAGLLSKLWTANHTKLTELNTKAFASYDSLFVTQHVLSKPVTLSDVAISSDFLPGK